MTIPLRVLIVEDRPEDAELMLDELRQADFDPDWQRVETEAEYLEHLDSSLDIILADYTLPGWDALRALELMQERGLDIPFVVVSGTIGEELAVEVVKRGAADYVLKDRLARLGPAIEHAREVKRLHVDREQVFKALRKSEERYRRLVETSPDAITLTDLDGKILISNQQAAELKGCESVDALVGRKISDFIAPEDHQRATDNLQETLTIGTMRDVEYTLVKQDGSRFPAELSVSVLNGEEGQPSAFIVVVRDITERRRAMERLRKLSSAVEQSASLVIITDTDGNVEYVNPKFSELTGYKDKEIIGQNPRILNSGLTPPVDYEQLWQTITSGQEWRGEFHNKKKNGEHFWALATISPIKDDAGHTTHFLAVEEDITESKRVQEALHESRRTLSTLMSNLPGIAYRCHNDEDWTMEFLSEGCLDLTGYEPEDLLHNQVVSYADMIHPDDREMVWDRVQSAVREDQPFKIVYRIVTRAGEMRWVWEKGRGVHRRDGSVHLEGFITDITERKRSELALSAERDLLHALMDNIPDQIYFKDAGGRYLRINKPTADNIGVKSPDEVIGRTVLDYFPTEFAEGAWADDQAVLGIGQPMVGKLERLETENSKSVWLSTTKVPISDSEGQVTGLVGISRDITQQVEAEEALQRYADRLETLRAIDRAILAAESPEEIAQSALDRMERLVPSLRASVVLVDLDADECQRLAVRTSGETTLGPAERIPLADFSRINIDALRENEVCRVDDLAKLTAGSKTDKALLEEGVVAYVSVPLFSQGTLIGALNLGAQDAASLDDEHVEIARQVADQLAVAISQAQLYDAERDHRLLAEALSDTASTISGTLDLESVLGRILENVGQVVPHDGANIMLIDEGQWDIGQVARGQGYEERGVGERVLSIRYPIAGVPSLRKMHESGQSLIIPDTHNDPDWIDTPELRWVRSYAGAPIQMEGKVIGFLNLDSATPNFFGPSISERLRAFADQAAIAIQNARLFSELQDRADRLELVWRVGQATTGLLSVEELLNQTVRLIAEAFGHLDTRILLVEEEALLLAATANPAHRDTVGKHRLRMDQGIAGWAATNGQPLYAPDVSREPRYHEGVQGTESELAVPMKIGDKVLGVLDVQSDGIDAFSQTARHALLTVADLLAVALQNAHAFEAERRQRALAENLAAAAKTLSSSLALEDVLDSILDQLRQVISYDSASLQQLEGNNLVIQACSGFKDPDEVIGLRFSLESKFPNMQVVKERQPLAIADVVETYPHFQMDADEYQSGNIRSWLGVPMLAKGQVIGMISLDRSEVRPFSSEEVQLAAGFASQAAVAVENAQLYQELEAYSEYLEQAVYRRTADLEREKQRAETILQSAGDAIVISDLEGHILSVNPAFEQQTGYTAEEAARLSNITMLSHPQTSRASRDELLERTRAGDRWRGELVMQRKDGGEYDADVSVAPLQQPGDNGEPQRWGYVSIIRDVSGQKELERMKDAFVSNVSHELRTPITGLKLFLGLLEKELPDDVQDDYLATLKRETDRLTNIIEDVLQLSRLDQDRVHIHLKPVDLNALAEEYILDRAPLAEERGLTLTLDKEDGLPPVQADAGLLEQALSGLLTNALNYTPSGGRIIMSTKQQNIDGGTYSGFVISDTGLGIRPDEQEHLFERFFRGSVGRNSDAPGTGLGLSIAKEIVDRHGGQIEVYSEGVPGKGTTFTVWLPVQE